ncbi:MAG TPA: nuclear transport factor 2 family protein [Thermomicrobiales bacterium]|nr:nuclear transport factor 2 family protein [Thermomicrobiales bacterium]
MTETMTTPARAGSATDEVAALVDQMYAAWRDRDEARIRTFFSDGASLLLWGTDRWERILGRAEADREFRNWIATCPPWVSIEATHRERGAADGLAWVADEVTGRWERPDAEGTDRYRITTIWAKQGGRWALTHANFANG